MSAHMRARPIEGSNGRGSKGDWRDIFHQSLCDHTEQGLYLKGLRLREGYTQADLARLIGSSQNNVSAMEHGSRPIGKNMAQKLAKIFNEDYRLFL